jgi:putative oxidoreductase
VTALLRLFSTFPDSWPGAALLLLRAIVGLAAIVQGFFYLSRGARSSPGGLLFGVLLAISGASLVIGFLTPIASILAGVGCVASNISWVPAPVTTLFDGPLVSLEMIVMAVSIAMLGPGAFALDARLFGRREIVIPPASRDPKV